MTQLKKSIGTATINPYGNRKPVAMETISTGQKGSTKTVMTHSHKEYSKGWSPDEHGKAAMVHHRKAVQVARDPAYVDANKKKQFVEHHIGVSKWHTEQANKKG